MRKGMRMKTLFLFLLTSTLVLACDRGTSPVTQALETSFTLTDTAGALLSHIRPGQDFMLSFNLVNTTHDTLTYQRANSGPPIVIRILRNDSTIAASVDGYVFLMNAPIDHLAPRDTLREIWKAPTTPRQNPKIVLKPGLYQARVDLPYFHQATVDPVPPIPFVVS